MKIYPAQIPREGVSLAEDFTPEKLDLNTEIIKFREPVWVKAEISKITNAVTFDLDIEASMCCLCSRCLEEFTLPLHKRLRFSYPVDRSVQVIDLDPDIREEIILEYPVKPLCRADCHGLCVKCGQNLNLGKCSCSN
ncbi:MAG: YceD family protein [Candidatus Omnitrophica bacterium]|nr:YceD family protein [Candidatus Omnitrophota bacterium]